jgi:2-C-methyl-D-erythritol 2,4-cyclodiphosphate synthase
VSAAPAEGRGIARIGYGEDAHALEAGRALVIGGVTIPDAPRGARAHSDGDVLLHALSDALLASVALGDIGAHFPDTDPAHRGADSAVLFARLLPLALARAEGLLPVQVAAVVTLDRPKLGPHRDAIAQRLATLLCIPVERVGITFKTSEGLAPDHVQARVMLLWG